jgi:hypothetical protein
LNILASPRDPVDAGGCGGCMFVLFEAIFLCLLQRIEGSKHQQHCHAERDKQEIMTESIIIIAIELYH